MELYIAVTVAAPSLPTGEVYHLALQSELRAPSRPTGPDWSFDEKRQVWSNPLKDRYIEYVIAKNENQWSHRREDRSKPAYNIGLSVVSWRKLSKEDHEKFNVDRRYRNAMRDRDGKLEYCIHTARECHRNYMRRMRQNNLPMLDIQWMRAMAAGDTEHAAAIEMVRQRWRDAPIDPRIDAAQSVAELKVIEPQIEE
jgi:hypothetical protein